MSGHSNPRGFLNPTSGVPSSRVRTSEIDKNCPNAAKIAFLHREMAIMARSPLPYEGRSIRFPTFVSSYMQGHYVCRRWGARNMFKVVVEVYIVSP